MLHNFIRRHKLINDRFHREGNKEAEKAMRRARRNHPPDAEVKVDPINAGRSENEGVIQYSIYMVP